MTLERYLSRRPVILHPMATAHEAARAMARHQIGAVLVGEHGRADGIVTDRDLALAVVAVGADPKRTLLEDVMSPILETVDVDDTIDDVLDAMLDGGCRRVPIVQSAKVVGIVTLDDLVVDGTLSMDELRPVVQAQLELGHLFAVDAPRETAPFDRAERSRMRHERRAENTFARMLHAVRMQTGLSTRARAASALRIVLGAICRRLAPNDAKHLVAQLPYFLRLELGGPYAGPDRAIDVAAIVGRLAHDLSIDEVHAEGVLSAVGNVIANSISRGENRLLRVHLPAELRDLFPERSAPAAAGG